MESFVNLFMLHKLLNVGFGVVDQYVTIQPSFNRMTFLIKNIKYLLLLFGVLFYYFEVVYNKRNVELMEFRWSDAFIAIFATEQLSEKNLFWRLFINKTTNSIISWVLRWIRLSLLPFYTRLLRQPRPRLIWQRG